MAQDLQSQIASLPSRLVDTISAIADAVSLISFAFRTASSAELPSANVFGDTQLQADVLADKIIFDRLRSSGSVSTASSEEQTDMLNLGGQGYSVAFDPLDGSSIIGANFAVGSIFGIWPGDHLIGQKAGDQVAACYGIYGPKTILVLACPSGPEPNASLAVREFTLIESSERITAASWQQSKASIQIGHKNVFAPANLRAAADNPAYSKLVAEWLAQKYTLRYSGGMVLDVHHILAKGGGIFCSPMSSSAPAKLRLLYEGAPLAWVVEAAGGATFSGVGSVLQQTIRSADERLVISLGSTQEVDRTKESLAHMQPDS